ncbi:hypothetical protein Kpol_473p22 [Vanderwaltozyma polyspora DSM 70294]|uniref:hydroxyacylglutathione hydrolase n=1 Tax=Vanderwaltozyma polyspora (strain ATCC 22028 / DSM 70294 / BCRC 21397 / CBS 2163 / NBRC 10782 / NRRL Y-8283 / UCD 57-17) TaxID=436907 RepID=A7TQ14_VANPO|nr:uncharacterized protein Kpol_473p22 [Vanderwaltozyma polyspora DSM 70294]EDO15663.1 hypothetical protein Kpol_473p22 [Vanderwaltozyma polyspora DSM 70294]
MFVKSIKMRWTTGGVNYSYLLSTADKTKSWLIDPAEPYEVLPHLNDAEMKSIQAIVNTHHHYDHAGGNKEILSKLQPLSSGHPIQIIGGSKYCEAVSEVPENLQNYSLGDLIISCIKTPCHTKDSICYYVKDPSTGEQCIFTGDTLFTAGCGRFFEGNGAEMDNSLNSAILNSVGRENLGKTYVYPGHEYTKSNALFVRSMIYPKIGDNKAFDSLEKFANDNDVTTGHYTLADELEFNPFMRIDDPAVRMAVGDKSSTWPREKVMDKLREMKNSM